MFRLERATNRHVLALVNNTAHANINLRGNLRVAKSWALLNSSVTTRHRPEHHEALGKASYCRQCAAPEVRNARAIISRPFNATAHL